MRRWSGWGEETVRYPLAETARRFLEGRLGPASPPREAAIAEVVARVPHSKLPRHPLISSDPEQRVRHAAGQSLPDWIALRSGTIAAFPDGVAHPTSSDDVRDLLRFAGETGAAVIPYGGGTSVVGHLSVERRPVISVDLSRMNRLLELDEESLLATFQAGARGPDIEATLGKRGYTLGHYPQSFEYSSLGGWVVTRSVGQYSLHYGRIEELFAGGRVEAPAGTLVMPPFPGSAAGPDLRQVVLGSEGRLGILTEAIVRVRRQPDEEFRAVFFPDFAHGVEAVRDLVRSDRPLLMLRLSTSEETTATLELSGRAGIVSLLERWLRVRGSGPERCMLIAGVADRRAVRDLLRMARKHRGVHMGRPLAAEWVRHRFRTPYLRNTLWEIGYAVDTLETAAVWARVPQVMAAVERALRETPGAYAFTHISHPYPTGANVYATCLFRVTTAQETLERWQALKGAASRAIVASGGTISHQHGVGTDHREYLEAEKGPLGIEALRALAHVFDPAGIMNPGKMV